MTLRVIIQLVPGGIERLTKELARLDIDNMGYVYQRPSKHQYRVIEQIDSGSARLGWMHDSLVRHRRPDGAWELVRKVLNKMDLEKPR